MAIKVLSTEDGLQAWRGNQMVAVQDSENENVRIFRRDYWQMIGNASNEREFRNLLEEFNIR